MVSPEETEIDLSLNLDATQPLPTAALPADAAGPQDTAGNWFAGATYSTVVTIYDSLGQGHDMTYLFCTEPLRQTNGTIA